MTIEAIGGRILVVGEAPENWQHLNELLSEHGYSVSTISGTRILTENVGEQNPDLVLLGSYGVNPYEICQTLLKNRSINSPPIIFLDSEKHRLNKQRVFQVGGADYLAYPWQAEDILCRIQHQLFLRQYQQSTETEEQTENLPTAETLNLYLHTVSHDLRNPVLALSLVLQNLLKESQTPLDNKSSDSIEPQLLNDIVPVPKAILEQMLKSCDRQLRLINALIEVQQLTLSGFCLNCQPLSLYQFTQTFITDWQLTLQQNQTNLQNQISRELPLVEADADQLWRVLENLTANAIKHNPPGVEIVLDAARVESSTAASMICYTVSDNGLGIAPELTEVIFERYRRGKKTKKILGLGLGLYLCRQIIQAHGGEIGVKSEPGKGTQFWFTLKIV